MIRTKTLLIFLLTVFLNSANSQNAKVDSLLSLVKVDKEDTTKVNHFNELCAEYRNLREYEESLSYGSKALGLGEKIKFNKGIAASCVRIGIVYSEQGENAKALAFYFRGLKTYEESKDENGISKTLSNIGLVYVHQGDYTEALENFLGALALDEKRKDKSGIANNLAHLGTVYAQQGAYPKVLECYFKALKIKEDLGDKRGASLLYNNIGIIYKEEGNLDKALEYYFTSLKIKKELGDKKGFTGPYNNIGLAYWQQGKYDLALQYFNEALQIIEEFKIKSIHANILSNIGIIYEEQAEKTTDKLKAQTLYDKALKYYKRALEKSEELGDKRQSTITLGNIGSYYANLKSFPEAEKYLLMALEIDTAIGYLDHLKTIHKDLGELYFNTGNFKKAYEHHSKYGIVKDSLFNIEKHEDITRKELNYEFDKKESIAKAEQEKKAILVAEERKKQNIIIWSVVAGLVLMMVFAIFIFRSLRVTQKQSRIIQKQKHLVEQQKHLVEEKHKEISDSINYAERIQRALLASKKLLDENLNDYFVLFKPKDVVSGDFYWATKLHNNRFVLVTADSTGHGVPGAIMSILNIACLKEAVGKGIERADLLLNETRELVIENLKNDGSIEGGKDGMDASLISFDFKNNEISCASANNPVWIIREQRLIEIKPDRMPIGKHDKDKTPFNLQTVGLQKDDIVYTLTDGFADQFGGASGKKFKYKQLQELLITIAHEPMENQKEKLSIVFDEWKGLLEQIDDVCLIGIKI